ncbi:hypothetical protein C8J56DRAFT_882108 [Mycena floridula]|nr:hypothetical protein C8J56DRAFT_882108 [Mycena floridula]
MRANAWKYGHDGHVFADLTFGFSATCANLMILLVIDSECKDVPVGILIFTIKHSVKAVHSDYDIKLITLLLNKWQSGLGVDDAWGYPNFKVASTDYNPHECNSFLDLFVEWYKLRLTRSKEVLHKLINKIIDYNEVLLAFNAKVDYFKGIGKKRDALSKKIAKGGLAFLTYLHSYLKTPFLELGAGESNRNFECDVIPG